MDGSGYPDGLQGDQIPPATHVIIVADAYDAMSSDRAYRPALAPDKIIEQLRKFSGSQFSPRVAEVFIDMIKNGEVPQQTPPKLT
jgi:HD-GYP domain-containing protein (c-di-GMP phosphodiesterase class II)